MGPEDSIEESCERIADRIVGTRIGAAAVGVDKRDYHPLSQFCDDLWILNCLRLVLSASCTPFSRQSWQQRNWFDPREAEAHAKRHRCAASPARDDGDGLGWSEDGNRCVGIEARQSAGRSACATEERPTTRKASSWLPEKMTESAGGGGDWVGAAPTVVDEFPVLV